MNAPKNTPWGHVQESETYADGIVFVYTAGHGGIVLSPTRERKVSHLKESNFLKSTKYWEEDCDWAVPFVMFQNDIKPNMPVDQFELMLAAAQKTVEAYHPDITLVEIPTV